MLWKTPSNPVNLLAHLHLSDGRPAAVAAGNLLADYLRRLDVAPLDAEFAAGVRLHRAIDAFADAHPALRTARAGFAPPWRRWAGILVDVACDYALSRYWTRFSAVPLRDYVDARLADIQLYLQACHPTTPLRPLFERATAEEWLLAYGTEAGLRLTFERMARRSPAAAALLGAEHAILQRQMALQSAFDDFYPRLLDHFSTFPDLRNGPGSG